MDVDPEETLLQDGDDSQGVEPSPKVRCYPSCPPFLSLNSLSQKRKLEPSRPRPGPANLPARSSTLRSAHQEAPSPVLPKIKVERGDKPSRKLAPSTPVVRPADKDNRRARKLLNESLAKTKSTYIFHLTCCQLVLNTS